MGDGSSKATGELSCRITALSELTLDELKNDGDRSTRVIRRGAAAGSCWSRPSRTACKRARGAGLNRRCEPYSSVFPRTQREAGWPSIGPHKSVCRYGADP
jgi:hypothetical protein